MNKEIRTDIANKMTQANQNNKKASKINKSYKKRI